MKDFNYWLLCEEVCVLDAVLLILDCDPEDYEDLVYERHSECDVPRGFDATFAAVTNAINAGTLPARIRSNASVHGYCVDFDNCDGVQKGVDSRGVEISYATFPDWQYTTVKVEDLKEWLSRRGYKNDFFFQDSAEKHDFLNSKHPQYSIKLAAAYNVRNVVVNNPELLRGKTPKTAIEIELRSNAPKYGLVKDDGSINERGIEEVAKVANWKTTGGAPESPGQ